MFLISHELLEEILGVKHPHLGDCQSLFSFDVLNDLQAECNFELHRFMLINVALPLGGKRVVDIQLALFHHGGK